MSCNVLIIPTTIFQLQILGMKILVTAGSSKGNPSNRSNPVPTKASEIIHIFKRGNLITSSFSVAATGFPKGESEGAFGGICHKKVVVGHGKHMFEYQISTNKWNRIDYEQNTPNDRFDAQSCTIHDTLILCGDWIRTDVELLSLKYLNTRSLSCMTGLNDNTARKTICSQAFCPTPLPLDVRYHAITKSGDRELILLGGLVNNAISHRVFQGTLTRCGKDVVWRELESMNIARIRHVTFKMKNHIYVLGGLVSQNSDSKTCERYNLTTNIWSRSIHSLPYPLCYAAVTVNDEETFAVITGGKKDALPSNQIIIFTENEGFKVSNQFLMERERFHHIAIKIG